MSFLQLFDLWARSINLCEAGMGHNLRQTSPSVLVIGGEDNNLYSLFQDGTETSISIAQITANDEKGEHHSATLSTTKVSMNIIQQQREYVCLTANSSGCISNSTICVYKNMGHFDGFISTPFMSNHVMTFLANDACDINGGSLDQIPSRNKHVCGCAVNGFNGVYCLDAMSDISLVNEPGQQSKLANAESVAPPTEHVDPMSNGNTLGEVTPAWNLILFGVLFVSVAAMVFLIIYQIKRQKENPDDTNPNISEEYNLKELNPYRDQFKRQPKYAGGFNLDGMSSVSHVHTRRLSKDSIELLQLYRRRSLGDSQIISSKDVNCILDDELLNSYRRREQMKQQYTRGDSIISGNESFPTEIISNHEGIADDDSDEFIERVTWDT